MMKTQVEAYIEAFGEENMPPPCTLFTIPNGLTAGANVYMVQKVFEGPFEVL